MENGEMPEGGRQASQHKVVMPYGNVQSITPTAAVQIAQPYGRSNQRVEGVSVLGVKKITALPKDVGLVVALDPKALLKVSRAHTPDQLLHTGTMLRQVTHVKWFERDG